MFTIVVQKASSDIVVHNYNYVSSDHANWSNSHKICLVVGQLGAINTSLTIHISVRPHSITIITHIECEKEALTSEGLESQNLLG